MMSDDESPDEVIDLAELVLKYARNGNRDKLEQLLDGNAANTELVNCRGKSKANREWTPLHLASYFGHASVVELLIKRGADLNAINDKDDTPLHKAAYTSRLDIVTLLLKANASLHILNTEGKKPVQLANQEEVRKLIQAAQQTEMARNEKKFLHCASSGDIDTLQTLLKEEKGLNVNCRDTRGNSALHLAAFRDRQQMAAFLMQAGVKNDIKNDNGDLASDIAQSDSMRRVLSLTPITDLRKSVSRMEGILYKKTRLFGFKPKYVVLDRGVLSIFNSLGDASSGARRRTFKYLDDAQCLVQSKDYLGIALVYNNGTSHIFRTESAENNVSRQRWVNALRAHISYSTYYMHKGVTDDSDEYEDLVPLSGMTDALQTAQAHQASLEKEVNLLTTSVGAQSLTTKLGNTELVGRCGNIVARSRDMCNVLQHCLTLFTQQEQLRTDQLSEERARCRVLQESLRLLAVQNYELEQQTSGLHSPGFQSPTMSSQEDSDDEFYDCDLDADNNVLESSTSVDKLERVASNTDMAYSQTDMQQLTSIHKHICKARKELPVPMLTRNEFSVWSILKQCIGKELSKITMPVVFNEPISFLQRLTEYMEYSYLLERASVCQSPAERMAYVSTFAISACASNWDRLGKPFNPLLGETYQLNKADLGYKVVCEQVSHHPPISAFHVTAEDFTFYGAINPKLKFWGKSVEITPKGVITVELTKHGETYTWENVNCSVHNIIVGKLWVEHHGRMEIINHKTGHKSEIAFKKSNMFSREVHRIEGSIFDNRRQRLLNLYGSWTDSVFSVEPHQWDVHVKPETKLEKAIIKSFVRHDSSVPDEIPPQSSTYNLNIPGQTFLWQADARPDNCEKYYSFTHFAMMLNELDEAEELCPTDSRLRPDIRCLEQGKIDDAAEKKVYLEEKQRVTRKHMKKSKEEWLPRWFRLQPHPVTGHMDWIYQGQYWQCDWSNCPEIF